ncbi:MAG TPA: hypothetical protein VGE96_03530 [Steroidobacteraceae bacterium]|jgi:hypothetical protein
MSSKVLVATLACVIPCIASAQQSNSPPAQQPGVQAQTGASAQGGATVERNPTNGAAVQSQGGAAGNASVAASKGDHSASAGGGAATNAVLQGSLDAKKAKPGDPVQAKTTEPASTPDHGTLPKGTRLLGHVTEAKAAGKGESQSTLSFVFDRAVLKDGREIPVNTVVHALAAADGTADASGPDVGGAMNGGAGAMGGAASRGGGLVGGVSGAASGALGGTTGGVGRVAGGASGAVGSTLGASGRALSGSAGAVGGIDAKGMLSRESQGVFGLKNTTLTQSASGSAGSAATLTSADRNVHLDSGTRMLLSVESAAANQPAATGNAAGSAAGSASAQRPAKPGQQP